MPTIFGYKITRENKAEKGKSYWVCPVCRTENQLGTSVCQRCAQVEGIEVTANGVSKEQEQENPLIAPLVKALDWYADSAQIKFEEVQREARLHGVYVKNLEEMQQIPVQQLDKVAYTFQTQNQLLVTSAGALSGLPGFPFVLATIPADISVLTYFSLRAISGISQSYGFETDSEQARRVALLLFAGASGAETLSIGGSELVVTNLATNVLPKPIWDRVKAKAIQSAAETIASKSFGRAIPIVGGLVGGTTSFLFLRDVGNRARNHFRMRLLENKSEFDGNPI